ncbi:MAG: UDP-N-acetylglucosamine 1-carboxyvinyltransferase [Oscillospiraceae bacterium]|jgi:UDP-N-acetylglucosamine 1-carboxyvinyltransferase|nr:UDP-N-acetylglucosamine 1-carboxyvinyltransferase [Oscillospiraceae bacterium]
MKKYAVTGGNPLNGEVTVSGAKNAAVAIIPAALMIDGVCRIENIPQISDVTMLLNILKKMGAEVRTVNRNTVDIDCTGVRTSRATFDAMRRIRASYYLIGALLSRFGHADVAMPGGCNFGGVRPIDQHVKGFTAMGATVDIKNGIVSATTDGGMRGTTVYLDVVSVGATINTMLAATLADGRTFIENAAKEPHIVDLANFLNSMGADIKGAGTNVIKVNGVKKLVGGFYSIIPDQIEAGTYMAAVAGTGGEVVIKNVIPRHLECISVKLREIGVTVTEGDTSVTVKRTRDLKRANIKTMPYPGFPTDMQPQIAAILCIAKGTSNITEGVWDNRFKYVDELSKMGGNITVNGQTASISGVPYLTGSPLKACDLRAGAALVIAALCARGTSEIEGVSYIERGYEDMIDKLRAIGADITCIEDPGDDDEDEQTAKSAG